MNPVTTKASEELARDLSAETPDPRVISYRGLRRAVGALGMALPLVLWAGRAIIERVFGLEPTVSDYYHTVMGDVFVGTLCAIGVFMLSYSGYDWHDVLAGKLASVFALLTALFPTAGPHVDWSAKAAEKVHMGAAFGLFATLAAFCFLFRRTRPDGTATDEKRQRNRVYGVCGGVIIACLVLIVIYGLAFRDSAVAPLHPVFWLEAVAIFFFGVAWMIKGETLFKDR